MDAGQERQHARRKVLRLDRALRPLEVLAPGLEDELDIDPSGESAHRLERCLVDAVGPAAAAEDEHGRAAGGEPELLDRRAPIAAQDVLAHRVAAHLEVVAAREVGARLDEREMDLASDAGEPAIGAPGDAVLLLEYERSAE